MGELLHVAPAAKPQERQSKLFRKDQSMPRWTDEARAKQREAIKRWSPWGQSTGPKTAEGKAVVARNPYKGNRRGQMRVIRRRLRVIMRELDELAPLLAPPP